MTQSGAAVSQTDLILDREVKCLAALISYVSLTQKADEKTVQTILEAYLGVEDYAFISRSDYIRAVEFLLDVKVEDMIN